MMPSIRSLMTCRRQYRTSYWRMPGCWRNLVRTRAGRHTGMAQASLSTVSQSHLLLPPESPRSGHHPATRDRRPPAFSTLSSRYGLPRERSECFGHDPHRTVAGHAGLDINAKHPFQTLCQGYCHGWHVCRFYRSKKPVMAARRATGVFSSPSSDTLGSAPLPRLAGITRARCWLFYPKGIKAQTPRGSGSEPAPDLSRGSPATAAPAPPGEP